MSFPAKLFNIFNMQINSPCSTNGFLIQVRINDPKANPLFSSGLIGKDNSIARHGIHGLYWLYKVDIPGELLVQGDNTIFLTQPQSSGPFQGIMYDYIRLEGPPTSSSKKEYLEYIVIGDAIGDHI